MSQPSNKRARPESGFTSASALVGNGQGGSSFDREVRGLNVSLQAAVRKYLEKDPFADLSNMYAEYDAFYKGIILTYGKGQEVAQSAESTIHIDDSPSPPPKRAAPAWNASFGSVTSNGAVPLKAAPVTTVPAFTFGGLVSAGAKPGGSASATAFGAGASKVTPGATPKSSTTLPFSGSFGSAKDLVPSSAGISFGKPMTPVKKSATPEPNGGKTSFGMTAFAESPARGTSPAPARGASPVAPFSFGGLSAPKPPVSTALAATTTPFSFGSAASTSTNAPAPTPFSFGMPPPSTTADATKKPFSFGGASTSIAPSFSFGTSTLAGSKATETPVTEAKGVETKADADDGEPSEEVPETTGPNEDLLSGAGEEGEETLIMQRVKVMKKDADGKWSVMGVGTLKVNCEREGEKKRRFLCRTDTGKLIFNSGFAKGVPPKWTSGQKTIQILAQVGDAGALGFILLQCKTLAEAEALQKVFEESCR